MAIYDPTTPPLFLTGKVIAVNGKDAYNYIDDTQISLTGAYITYNITVEQIAYQSIGTASTRSGAAKQYNALDVKAGDWITNTNGQIVLQIVSVSDKTETSISFVAKDIDMVSYKTYASTYFSINDGIAFFEVSDNRVPMLTTAGIQTFFNTSSAIDKIQGRFAAEEETERYRFEFATPQTGFSKGDIITVNIEDGTFVRFGAIGSSAVPMGVVLEKIMNDTVIYVKPFNTIIDNHTSPELLTGSAGEIYYADPSNPGALSTTKFPGSTPLFLQVKDATPTKIQTETPNYLPTSNDLVKINNTTVFDGSIYIVPASIQAFVDLINGSTASHNVIASKISEYATSISNASNTTNGVSIIAISEDSGATYNPLTVTFSDGTTSVVVTFDENQGVPLVEYPDSTNYLTYNASAMATVLNNAFINNGLNLAASSILPGDGAHPSIYGNLVIEATDPAASIIITGTDSDVLGDSFLSGVGIAANTPAGAAEYLVLERLDGGDIMITGAGTYINNNGLTSSSAGTAAVLLMLETGGATEQETGVNVSVDKNQTVISNTTHDHYVTGINIDYTPFADGDVIVKINGVEINIGDGDNTEDAYFTDPTDVAYNSEGNAMSARLIKDITAGDVLIWNGSAAGYELDMTDDVDIVYQASSFDL